MAKPKKIDAPDDTKPPEPHTVEIDGLSYRLDGPPRRSGRSVVAVRLAGADPGPPLQDRVDLYSFRSRKAFAQVVGDQFARPLDAVMGHLALLLDQAERSEPAQPPEQLLTPERKEVAEDLLRDPRLLDRAAAVMSAHGHVGEEHVKRITYLVATSRLLGRPLSVLLLAPSGAGKSTVLDVTLAMLPPEHVVSVARLTPHSLYYMGPHALRHRLVVVDELEGQQDADHAVRVLQSKGELTQTAMVKGKAETFSVRGPVAVMSGTTRSDVDPQNASRCIELALDDSPAQTARIHEAQARAWSGQQAAPPDLGLWHDAQRVLAEAAPVAVAIPFAPRIQVPARTTTDRRAGPRLFGLVAASALLHSRQRDRDAQGRVVATVDDYALVHGLVRPVVEHACDGLSPRAARAHAHLAEAGQTTRRDLAAALGWGYSTARRALDELVDQELVVVAEREPPARYRLLDHTLVVGGGELTPPDDLRPRAARGAATRRA